MSFTESTDRLWTTFTRSWDMTPWLFGVVVLLALAPLPFGSVPPIWKNVLSGTSLLLFAAFIAVRGRRISWPPHGNGLLTWSAILFGAVCLWMAFQAAPFAPTAWHHPAWQIAGEALEQDLAGSISLDPGATIEDLISLLGVAAVFAIVVIETREASKARALFAAVGAIAFLYAVYGLVVFLTGNETVAWVEKRHYTESLSSTFVNRNTYGVYAGLGLLAATALLVSHLAPIIRSRQRRNDKWRAALSYLFGAGGMWLVSMIVGASALLLTGSRAATTASAVGFVALLAMYLALRRATAASVTLGITIILATSVSLFLLSGDLLFDRLTKLEDNWKDRNAIYELVFVAIDDHFWLGAGYGAFDDVFRIYAGLADTFGRNIQAAHSVFLEVILELGAPAASLLFWSVGLLVYSCLRGLVARQRDRIFPVVAIAATLLVSIQGAVDFGIQTPALTTLYAVLLGAGVAQSTSSHRLN